MPTISMFYGILIKMNWKDVGQHSQQVPFFTLNLLGKLVKFP